MAIVAAPGNLIPVREQADPLAAVYTGGEAGATALACPDDGSSISFGELAERVDTLARALRGLGVDRSDRVALALPNGPEIVELLLAVTALGAAAAPLNPAYTPDELTFYLEDLEPRLLLLPEGELEAARTAAARLSVRIADIRSDDGRTVVASSARPAAYEPGAPGRRRDSPAHERHDEPAQAGAAAATQSRRFRALDGGPLPAVGRRRLLRRHAALPRTRSRCLDVRSSARRRDGRRAQTAGTAAASGSTWASTA